MTVADAPKPDRAKPILERFEAFESHPTAHLTDEQKTWRVVKLRPRAERFEVLKAQPALTLKLHLDGSCTGAEGVTLARAITDVVEAVSEAERALGGAGLALVDQKAEPRTVILTLRHATADGASERAAQLAAMLNDATNPVQAKLRGAGAPVVVRCEVLTPAA